MNKLNAEDERQYDRIGRFLNDRSDTHGVWIEQVNVYVCPTCAAFTADPATHDEWHSSPLIDGEL